MSVINRLFEVGRGNGLTTNTVDYFGDPYLQKNFDIDFQGRVYEALKINRFQNNDFVNFLKDCDYYNNPNSAINMDGFEPRGAIAFEGSCLIGKVNNDVINMYERLKSEYGSGFNYYTVIYEFNNTHVYYRIYQIR